MLHENLGRQNESLIDEANRIQSMKRQGLTKHTPTIKEVEALYSCVEKPASMTDEEWALCINPGVRRVIAFYLDNEFSTFEDMVKAKGQAARGASC